MPFLPVVCVQRASLACRFIVRSPAAVPEFRQVFGQCRAGVRHSQIQPARGPAGAHPALPPTSSTLPSSPGARFSGHTSLTMLNSSPSPCPCPALCPRFCPFDSGGREGGSSSHILLASAQMSRIWTELSQQFRPKWPLPCLPIIWHFCVGNLAKLNKGSWLNMSGMLWEQRENSGRGTIIAGLG